MHLPYQPPFMRKIQPLVTPLVLLAVSYGCVQKAPEEARLEIKGVQQTGSNGVYNVVGSTNLADSSLITVAAVRYLHPTEGQSEELLNKQANTNRSILDRQIVEIKQGQWQANLNLWQVAPNGSFAEVWQANQAQLKLTPESGVTFIATFDPAGQPQKSDQQTSKQPKQENQKLEGKLLRFTNEGETYVQASQILSIPLPVGKTIPPRPQPEDLNGGWGTRYQIQPQSIASRVTLLPPAKFSKTNAPLTPSEFLR
ncbi:MAG: hypothetical protein DSM106950_22685 [Stigonema ocellatum SAG 48.90 = DSM 106950]|nr:hypothetical protein [Stigonema ocellatum SAG 48.90 = DSM 106950]